MPTPEVVEQVYRPHGNLRRIFRWLDGQERPPPRVLVEGPAGTGKTRAIAEFLYETAERYPWTRILVVRKFRADLRDGWQKTFETQVLWPEHPLVRQEGYGQGEHRSRYVFENGSEIVLGHMDDPQRWYSSEWDIVYWNEAVESRKDVWEKLGRAVRKGDRPTRCPFGIQMGDTNPDTPRHHLNLACNEGRVERIRTRHEDNPRCSEEDLERLRAMSGADRRRLYLGEWCDNEGRIIDTFDQDRHVLGIDEIPGMAFHVAGLDFGRTQALVVLGYPEYGGPAYVVREVYRYDEHQDWWAAKVHDIIEEFRPVRVIADSANHRDIVFLNSRLSGSPVVPVVKSKRGDKSFGEATRAHLRTQFATDMLYVLDDAMRVDGGPDHRIELGARCLTDELLEWPYRQARPGQVLPVDSVGDPDPTYPDHAIDALIYALTWSWQKDFTPKPAETGLPDYSMGAVLGHRSVRRIPGAGGSTFDYTPSHASRRRKVRL